MINEEKHTAFLNVLTIISDADLTDKSKLDSLVRAIFCYKSDIDFQICLEPNYQPKITLDKEAEEPESFDLTTINEMLQKARKSKRPPHGIMPRKFWLEDRAAELGRAIKARLDFNEESKLLGDDKLIEWMKELANILKELEGGNGKV